MPRILVLNQHWRYVDGWATKILGPGRYVMPRDVAEDVADHAVLSGAGIYVIELPEQEKSS